MPLGDVPYERVGEGVVVSTDRVLFTWDAATLYARHGVVGAEGLPSYMEIVDREVYRRAGG